MSYLKNLLTDLIGTYNPVSYYVGEDEIIAPGMAGVDWQWVASAALFILVIYSLFRIIRALVAR